MGLCGSGDRYPACDVKLSKHDIEQLDDAYIGALPEGALRVLTAKLLADLKEAHDRLGQNPSNSSRPPSSRPPWAGGGASEPPVGADEAAGGGGEAGREGSEVPTPPRQDRQARRAPEKVQPSQPPPGKAGKRAGSPGHGRTQRLEIDAERLHRPEVCAGCGAPLSDGAERRAHAAHYEIDLVKRASGNAGLAVVQTKHVYLECRCGCGHWTRAEPGHCPGQDGWTVALSERHLAGPLLVALICALSLRMHLSRRRIREFLGEWFGLDLAVGTIDRCLREAARALEPVVQEQVLAEIRAADLLHADETGWKQHGRPLWLWVFRCAAATLFVIDRRTQEVLHRVLGAHFAHWLMSDGYWAYRDYDWRLRCLAHLVRKARGLEESLEREAQRFGRHLLDTLETLMAAVYAAREGPPGQGVRERHAPCLAALLDACLRHSDAAHDKTRALARELLNDWDTFWVVLDYPWLPLTNNEAERALRHWVIARRISYGTRTAQGSRAFALLASVIETCRQRGASPWPYIAEVLRQRRQGKPAPLLPQFAA